MYRVVDLDLLMEVKLESGLLQTSAVPAKILSTYTDSLWYIHNLQIRLVTQVVDLCPEYRHTPSGLHKAEPFLSFHSSTTCDFSVGGDRIKQDNLLSLIVVGGVSVRVDTTGEVSCSGTVPGPTRNQEKEEFAVVDGC